VRLSRRACWLYAPAYHSFFALPPLLQKHFCSHTGTSAPWASKASVCTSFAFRTACLRPSFGHQSWASLTGVALTAVQRCVRLSRCARLLNIPHSPYRPALTWATRPAQRFYPDVFAVDKETTLCLNSPLCNLAGFEDQVTLQAAFNLTRKLERLRTTAVDGRVCVAETTQGVGSPREGRTPQVWF
jgi:hypothetical protein